MSKQPLVEGSTLDGFLIGEKLHTGGMATLWRVTRDDIDIPIVMKVPMILDGDDATTIVGFEMEQMILPMLSGPHVPKFFAIGDFATQPYIVMEYIDGDSLLPLLDTAPRPVEEVVGIGARVARALSELHRQHVLHLDIKPSNIMIRKSGEAAFIDFGLSRHEMLPDLLAEEFHLPMGTGPYISPEQIVRNRTDPRSDIFSLGVLMYHLLTRQRPFGFPRNNRGLRKRLWRDPVPPRAIKADIPPWLQEIVLRCLEIDPANRYPTAAQLAFDLQHPDEVRLSHRADRTRRDPIGVAWRRWWRTVTSDPKPATDMSAQMQQARIVLAAVDLSPGMEIQAEQLRVHVRNVLETHPGMRLACVNVLKTARIGMNYPLDDSGRNIHVQRLVELKEWARPLGEWTEQVTFHVLEHPDPAAALIEYVRSNHVDHVLIGARASSTLRRYLGSVSSQVVAEAPCTVTVVRVSSTNLAHLENANAIEPEVADT